MIINQANLHGLTAAYSAAFNKTLWETKTHYREIATEVPSSTSENTYAWLGQMSGMREWIGDREIQHISEYGYTIKNRKFERTQAVPRDAIEDDQYGVYSPMFSMIGEEAAQHPDDLVFSLLRAGFTTACYDGKPFFSDSHKSGKNIFSNRTDAPLSAEEFLKGRTAVMSLRGDKDKALNIIPDLLVVSPKNESEARKILEAELINGTSNPTKGMAKLLVATQLAGKDEDMWFLLATNKFIKPLIFQKRKPVKFTMMTRDTDMNVFMADEFLYGVDCRDNVGYSFWQMAYGSTGKAKA